jgi:hypothetical protein
MIRVVTPKNLFPEIYRPFVETYMSVAFGTNKEYQNFIKEGGRSSGKTQTILKVVWLCLILRPKSGAVMVQPLSSDIRDKSFATSKKMLRTVCKSLELEYDDIVEKSTVSPASIILKNGSKMKFMALDSEKNSRGGDLDDATVEHVIFDECSLYKDLDLMGSMRATYSRQGGDDESNSMVKYTYIFNPPKNAKDRIYKYLNEYQNHTYRIFTTYLDIYELLPKGAILDIETQKKQNLTAYRQRYLGEMVGVEGLIFPNFRENCWLDERENVHYFKSFITSDYGSKDAFVYSQAWHTSHGVVVDMAYYHDGASMGDLAPSQAAEFIKLDLQNGYLNNNYDSILIDSIPVKLELEKPQVSKNGTFPGLRKVYDTQNAITKNRRLQIGLLQSLVYRGLLKFKKPKLMLMSEDEKKHYRATDPFNYQVDLDNLTSMNIIIEQMENAQWHKTKDSELNRVAPNSEGTNIDEQVHSVDMLAYLCLMLEVSGVLKKLGVQYVN